MTDDTATPTPSAPAQGPARPSDTHTLSALLLQIVTLSRSDQIRLHRYVADLPDLEDALRHTRERPALLRNDTEDDMALIVRNLAARWQDQTTAEMTVRHMHAHLNGQTGRPDVQCPGTLQAPTPTAAEPPAGPAPTPTPGTPAESAPAERPGDRNAPAGDASTASKPPAQFEDINRKAWQEASRTRLYDLLNGGTSIDALFSTFNELNDTDRPITKTMIRRTAKAERQAHLPDACYRHVWTLQLPEKPQGNTVEQQIATTREICRNHNVDAETLLRMVHATFDDAKHNPNIRFQMGHRFRERNLATFRHAGTIDETELQMLLEGLIELDELNLDQYTEADSVELIANSAILAATGNHLIRLKELGYELSDLDAPMRRLGWTGRPLEEISERRVPEMKAMIDLLSQIVLPNETTQPDPAGQEPRGQLQDADSRTAFINDILDRKGSILTNEITKPFGIKGGAAVQLLKDMGLHPLSGGRYRRQRA